VWLERRTVAPPEQSLGDIIEIEPQRSDQRSSVSTNFDENKPSIGLKSGLGRGRRGGVSSSKAASSESAKHPQTTEGPGRSPDITAASRATNGSRSTLLSLTRNRLVRAEIIDQNSDDPAATDAASALRELAPRVSGAVGSFDLHDVRNAWPAADPTINDRVSARYVLKASDDGSLKYSAPDRSFEAVIHPNGDVTYNDGSGAIARRLCLLVACPHKFKSSGISPAISTLDVGELAQEGVIVEGLERDRQRGRHGLVSKPAPPVGRFAFGFRTKRQIEAKKREFSKATRQLREQLYIASQQKAVIEGLDGVNRDLERIWRGFDPTTRKHLVLERLEYVDASLKEIEMAPASTPSLSKHRAWMKENLWLYRLKLKRFICEHQAPAASAGFSASEAKECSRQQVDGPK
jgi:hypothetical protein